MEFGIYYLLKNKYASGLVIVSFKYLRSAIMASILDNLQLIIDQKKSPEEFEAWIEKLRQTNSSILDHQHWLPDGTYESILSYLIKKYQNDEGLILSYIWIIVNKDPDLDALNIPHLILQLKRTKLYTIVTGGEWKAPVDLSPENPPAAKVIPRPSLYVRDKNTGSTLLSSVIKSEADDVLADLLTEEPVRTLIVDQLNDSAFSEESGSTYYIYTPLINAPSRFVVGELPPLHQAVIKNYASGVKIWLDVDQSALSIPCLEEGYTPLLLAAKEGHYNSLVAILHQSNVSLVQQKTIKYNLSAVDLLCERLEENTQPDVAIRAIACLLCRGADAPATQEHQDLLMKHRGKLLSAISSYNKLHPEFVKPTILRKAHDKLDPLHHILYSSTGFFNSISRFFSAEKTAWIMESLINDKNRDQFTAAERNFSQYAKDYEVDFERPRGWFDCRNFRSKALHAIATGDLQDWSKVMLFKQADPTTRTSRVVDQMNPEDTGLLEQVDHESHRDDRVLS